MLRTRQTIAAIVFAMATLPLASTALAADDEPIVNDYSKMGADYSPSSSSDSAKASESEGAGAEKSTSSQSASSENADGKLYEVNCDVEGPCQVSEDVMVGYEKFGGHCAQCHAQNAEGSTFAPSLVKRLQNMGQGRFTAAVAGGVTRMDTTTGTYSVMPAWNQNEDVMSHLQQIWAFLKARSDGALPAGRPKQMENNG